MTLWNAVVFVLIASLGLATGVLLASLYRGRNR